YYQKIIAFISNYFNNLTFSTPSPKENTGSGVEVRPAFMLNVANPSEIIKLTDLAKFGSMIYNMIQLNKGTGSSIDTNPVLASVRYGTTKCQGGCINPQNLDRYEFMLHCFKKARPPPVPVDKLIISDKVNALCKLA